MIIGTDDKFLGFLKKCLTFENKKDINRNLLCKNRFVNQILR